MEPSWTNWRKWDRLTWLLIAITAAGIFLRFYKIDYYGLWLDESATIWFSNHSFYEIFNLTAQGEYNPPLFYWIEHVVMYFGTNEFTMRLVPAICGCLTIPVFYKIGERLKDRSVGVMMAALLAFSPFAIFYSQEARTYSLTLLIMAVMFLWYLKAQSNFDWIMIGVLGALAFWSHFFSILFFGVILLWEFTQTWELKPPVLSGAVFVGLTTPITLVTISLFGLRTSSPPTYGVQGLEVIKETALQFSGFNLWAMFAFLVLFVLGIFWLSINDKKLTLIL